MKESINIRNIFSVFYDKELTLLRSIELTDDDTGHVKVISIPDKSFGCNIQHTTGAIMVKEFGKEYDASFRVSCPIETGIKKSDYFYKDNQAYHIVDLIHTEQSTIFLIKEDEQIVDSNLVTFYFNPKGELVAKLPDESFEHKIVIDERGRFTINEQYEGFTRIDEKGHLRLNLISIAEALEDD